MRVVTTYRNSQGEDTTFTYAQKLTPIGAIYCASQVLAENEDRKIPSLDPMLVRVVIENEE